MGAVTDHADVLEPATVRSATRAELLSRRAAAMSRLLSDAGIELIDERHP